jgi:monothiol glutaredoxin
VNVSDRPQKVPAHAIATTKLAAFKPDIVSEVAAAVGRDKVVVVGMSWNSHCTKARARLDAAGIAHTYLNYGNYVVGWRDRLALKLWADWPTFPQVFVAGTFVGGDTELEKLLADGTIGQMLAAAA